MYTYVQHYKDEVDTDVLVVGGGCSGATAAITAGRLGARVLLVERYGFMGGTSTQVLDTFYGFYTPGENPVKVVGGVPDNVVEKLKKKNRAFLRPNTYGAGTGVTYDQEMLKIVWEQMAQETNVRLLYHTFVLDSLIEEDRIIGVVAANKRGLLKITANIVIDASGDADIAASAGVPFDGGKEGPIQAMTTTFRLINVDVERASEVSKEKLQKLMKKAAKSGKYRLPRKEGSVHVTPFSGVMATNMVRVSKKDTTDPEHLTLAEIEGRKQAVEYTRFLRDFAPGYEEAELISLSTQIGIRESRRILGDYRITKNDVMEARKFDDVIAQCGAPIEEHHGNSGTKWEYLPEGETYHLPYRCLLPKKIEGLLVSGRCLSADHDAHASVRNMAQCMAMGQAAGTASAIAIREKIMPRAVSIPRLQEILRNQGAIL